MTKCILGFTIKKIDAAKCWLTPAGLEKLNPCSKDLITKQVKITPKMLKKYQEYDVAWWLSNMSYYGPKNWGWKNFKKLRIDPLDTLTQSRYLKAYIMKHGIPGKP